MTVIYFFPCSLPSAYIHFSTVLLDGLPFFGSLKGGIYLCNVQQPNLQLQVIHHTISSQFKLCMSTWTANPTGIQDDELKIGFLLHDILTLCFILTSFVKYA